MIGYFVPRDKIAEFKTHVPDGVRAADTDLVGCVGGTEPLVCALLSTGKRGMYWRSMAKGAAPLCGPAVKVLNVAESFPARVQTGRAPLAEAQKKGSGEEITEAGGAVCASFGSGGGVACGGSLEWLAA